jgi:hypothetical protein
MPRIFRVIAVLGAAALLSTTGLLPLPNALATVHERKSSLLPKDCAHWVADLTIPDGTTLTAGDHDTKTWQVLNCSKLAWKNYSIAPVFGYGPQPGLKQATPPDQKLPVIKPGHEGDISVPIAVPNQPGEYKIIFELLDPDGIHRFGDVLTIDFKV